MPCAASACERVAIVRHQRGRERDRPEAVPGTGVPDAPIGGVHARVETAHEQPHAGPDGVGQGARSAGPGHEELRRVATVLFHVVDGEPGTHEHVAQASPAATRRRTGRGSRRSPRARPRRRRAARTAPAARPGASPSADAPARAATGPGARAGSSPGPTRPRSCRRGTAAPRDRPEPRAWRATRPGSARPSPGRRRSPPAACPGTEVEARAAAHVDAQLPLRHRRREAPGVGRRGRPSDAAFHSRGPLLVHLDGAALHGRIIPRTGRTIRTRSGGE